LAVDVTLGAVAVGNGTVGAGKTAAGEAVAGAVTTLGVVSTLAVLAALGAQADTNSVNRIKVVRILAWVCIMIAPIVSTVWLY